MLEDVTLVHEIGQAVRLLFLQELASGFVSFLGEQLVDARAQALQQARTHAVFEDDVA